MSSSYDYKRKYCDKIMDITIEGKTHLFFPLILYTKQSVRTIAAYYLFSGSPGKQEEENAGYAIDDINAKAQQLLDRYGNKLLRLAYSYLHNMADAEDIVQETLIQFLKKAPAFADETHEIAWLMRVAGNMSKNRIRYNRYRLTDELREELTAAECDDLSFVWEAVKSLPVLYREVIHLYYHDGCSTMQIASILGKKETTVRSCLARGRIKLKSILKEEYDFDGEV